MSTMPLPLPFVALGSVGQPTMCHWWLSWPWYSLYLDDLCPITYDYSLARDGLMPAAFKELTKTSKVPRMLLSPTGLASAVAAGMFPLASIAAFLNICTLAYLIMLAYGLISITERKGDAQSRRILKHHWYPYYQFYQSSFVYPLCCSIIWKLGLLS